MTKYYECDSCSWFGHEDEAFYGKTCPICSGTLVESFSSDDTDYDIDYEVWYDDNY